MPHSEEELDLILASLPPIAGGDILGDIWDILQGVYRLVTDPYGTIVQPIADWVRKSLADAYREVYGQVYPSLLPETLVWITSEMDRYPIPAILMGIAKLIWHRITDPIIRWFREVKADVGTFFSKLWERIYQVPLGAFRQAYQWLWDWAIWNIPEQDRWMFPRDTTTWGLDQYAGKMFALLWQAILSSFRSVWRNVNAVWERVYNVPLGYLRRGYEWAWNHIYASVLPEEQPHFPRYDATWGLDEYAGKLFALVVAGGKGQVIRGWQSFYDIMRDWYVGIYNGELEASYPYMTDEEKRIWPYLPLDASFWTAVKQDARFTLMRYTAGHRRTVKELKETGGDIKGFIQKELIDPLGDWTKAILDAVAEPGKRVWEWLSEKLHSIWERVSEWWDESLEPKLQKVANWFKRLGEGIRDALLGPLDDILTTHSPVSIEDSFHLGKRVLLAGVAGVLGTGAVFTGLELAHPLKNMGLGKLAEIYFGAMNYQAITGCYILPLTYAAIRNPVQMYFNRMFRTGRPSPGDAMDLLKHALITKDDFDEVVSYSGYPQGWIDALASLSKQYPAIPDLAMMYAKKETTDEQFTRYMRWWGYDDEMLEIYRRYLWMDPRLTELIRIAQLYRPPTTPDPRALAWLERAGIPLPDPDAWWFTYKIAKAGYEPIDIPILTEVAKLGIVRREQTLYFEAARRLYRDGLIDSTRVRELTADAWVSMPPVDYRLKAVNLDVEYANKAAIVQIVLRSYTRGLLDESDAIGLLGDIGMDGTRVRLNLLREKLGLLPTVRLAPPAEQEELALGGD